MFKTTNAGLIFNGNCTPFGSLVILIRTERDNIDLSKSERVRLGGELVGSHNVFKSDQYEGLCEMSFPPIDGGIVTCESDNDFFVHCDVRRWSLSLVVGRWLGGLCCCCGAKWHKRARRQSLHESTGAQ